MSPWLDVGGRETNGMTPQSIHRLLRALHHSGESVELHASNRYRRSVEGLTRKLLVSGVSTQGPKIPGCGCGEVLLAAAAWDRMLSC